MNKKFLIAVGSALAVVVVGSLLLYPIVKTKKLTVPQPQEEATLTQGEQNELVWDDPAGFTFRYPKDVAVDKHDEDQENYAHVEMTHVGHPGNLIVWAKDTNAKDVSSWVKTEPRFKEGSVSDTTIGGEVAKKVIMNEDGQVLVVGTVYDGLLFLIETTATDKEYWTGVQAKVIESFTFKTLTDGTNESGSEDEEPVDEEEVLE